MPPLLLMITPPHISGALPGGCHQDAPHDDHDGVHAGRFAHRPAVRRRRGPLLHMAGGADGARYGASAGVYAQQVPPGAKCGVGGAQMEGGHRWRRGSCGGRRGSQSESRIGVEGGGALEYMHKRSPQVRGRGGCGAEGGGHWIFSLPHLCSRQTQHTQWPDGLIKHLPTLPHLTLPCCCCCCRQSHMVT